MDANLMGFQNNSSTIVIKLALILTFAGNVAAIIVSLPHESYVLQGNRGTIRCQNRSADERVFYSYITNAVWYRDYENGTEKRIGTSGSVYSSRHLLNFIPTVKKVDEGVYYCCVPNGPCGNSITSRTVVKISTPPMILAAKSTYTSFSGSNIVLRCNIIDQGVPPAVFSWRKNGYRLNGDYIILIDSTVMEIKLMNLTFENAGVYTCAADGLLSDRSDSIKLTVESINNTTTDDIKSQVIQVLAEDLNFSCKNTETAYINAALYQSAQQICNCTDFKINAILLNCTDNNRALYTIQLTGPSVDNILQLWSDYQISTCRGIDVGVATISLRNNACFTNEQDMCKCNAAKAPISSSTTLISSTIILLYVVYSQTIN